jgi:formylglycine-generating enzyme required for sulfatase activity
MDPYALPEELTELQSQDMGRLGFIQDLVRGVEKVLGRDGGKSVEKAGVGPTSSEMTGWLRRAWLFLEDGEFGSAKEYAERVLDREPETGEAYWVQALAGFGVRRESDLSGRRQSLTGEGNYQKALRFGTAELKRRLEGFEAEIQKRIAEDRRKKEEELQRSKAERMERERLESEARARAKAEERERHVGVLAAVREQVATGNLEAAGQLLGSLGSGRHEGVDYAEVANVLTRAQTAQAEVETRLKESLEELRRMVTAAPPLIVFPPLRPLSEHRAARSRAGQAMSGGANYLERVGGASGGRVWVLYEELRGLEERIARGIERLGRLVKVLGVVWAIVLTAAGLMFQQHLVTQQRERQRLAAEAKAAEERALAEARAKAEAEEKERQRLAAEAKAAEERALAEARAKAEAAETLLATKLGLSLPFTAGGRGQAGGLAVRWIPAGRFRMGSPPGEEGRDSDEVAHEVVLSRGFFMAETECTQGQWEAVMGSNPSLFKGDPNRPVENVSWEEAVEYCRKLTTKQQAEGILPEGWKWRLPTEAEWEYAARAGTTGARHGELDAIAWYTDNSGGTTHAVKGKQANAWGLHDMMGNVWELCSDWYGDYPTGAVTDPTGPVSGSFRVFRGGSSYSDAGSVRSANRETRAPGNRLRYLGFRYLGFRPALSSVG